MTTHLGETGLEFLRVIKQHPDVTVAELKVLMPHKSESSVASMCHSLVERGYAIVSGKEIREGSHRPRYTFRVSPHYTIPKEGVTKAERLTEYIVQPDQPYKHSPVSQRELFDELVALRIWREDAIRRYPDLEVPQGVLRARKLLADEYASSDDPRDRLHAEHILTGLKDDCPAICTIVRALEEVG